MTSASTKMQSPRTKYNRSQAKDSPLKSHGKLRRELESYTTKDNKEEITATMGNLVLPNGDSLKVKPLAPIVMGHKSRPSEHLEKQDKVHID